jgi:hypothetical protein
MFEDFKIVSRACGAGSALPGSARGARRGWKREGPTFIPHPAP